MRSLWVILVLLVCWLPSWCAEQEVVVDGYTSTQDGALTSGEAVPLGTVLTLICRVNGLPADEPRTYTWTCLYGPCREVNYGIALSFEHILVVNITSISDGGTYICQVTGRQLQGARGSFTVTVTAITVIDGYTHSSTLTSGDSVPLGAQVILVCRVVGLPYGTPFSYTWTCPNGTCEVEGYHGRKIYNENVLVVNTTSTSDGGTYTCFPSAKGFKAGRENFLLGVSGGRVVHSYGRLLPHEFPITNIEQISGLKGIGRITCTVSSGTAQFDKPGSGDLDGGGVTETRKGDTATLDVDPSHSRFKNEEWYCVDQDTNFLYIFISDIDALLAPTLTVNWTTSTGVEYNVDEVDRDTDNIIAGYEVYRYGVPMLGVYVNGGRQSTVTISPAVPGTRYRIVAMALGHGRRSDIPAVASAFTATAIPTAPRLPFIVRVNVDGIELNWLPPTEPNGEVHYVIYYTPEGGTEQSIDTGSNLTHYNLTGLEKNRVYTNISVQANSSSGKSGRSPVIARYNHTLPLESGIDATLASVPLLRGADMSVASSLQPSENDLSPSPSLLLPGNDMHPRQTESSSTSAGRELLPAPSVTLQGTVMETGNEASTPTYSVTLRDSVRNGLLSIGNLEQSTVIGIVTGALGVVVLILLLVCVMLLAVAAKPRRTKRRPEAQSSNGDDVHDPSLLCMTSSSTLSYYEDAEEVLAALKAKNACANGRTSHKRSIASDNLCKDDTRESYVSVESILDAKRSDRDERLLHSMAETVETYEDMDGTILDAKRSDRDERRLHSMAETVETYEDMDGTILDTTCLQEDQHSWDETWEKYEVMNSPLDMAMLTGMNQLQGDKHLHSLNEGWEEDMDSMPVYYNSFEDMYDSDELNNDAGLDKRPKGKTDIHALGKPGHEMAKKMGVAMKYGITDIVLKNCDACEEIYDDIADVEVIYDVVGEPETDRQLDKCPKTDAQPPKLPPRLPVKLSVKQLAQSLKQQNGPTAGPLHGQQANEGPDKLTVGKTPARYQALCQPTLADIRHQYTKLRHNQEHQDLKRPPSYQYSSMRETLRRTGAGGEVTGRPLSRPYSSLRKPSHRTGEDRPPSHQYSSVGGTPHSTDETGGLQYMQYI